LVSRGALFATFGLGAVLLVVVLANSLLGPGAAFVTLGISFFVPGLAPWILGIGVLLAFDGERGSILDIPEAFGFVAVFG